MCIRRSSIPLTKFYETPTNLASTNPGDLLRRENATEYTLPEGTKAQRILYHSLDAECTDVATSAVVLVPPGRPPRGGWPVVASAHSTTGVARQCAPSLMNDYYNDKIGFWLKAGFAVVATDYHGLGTSGAHQYINGLSQGYDVVYSVKAAHAAEPALDQRWVAHGLSQGSTTAWGVAAIQYKLKDPNYLGAVAIAGGMQKAAYVEMLANSSDAELSALMVLSAFGIKARFPKFDPTMMLTDTGMRHYKDVTTKGCLDCAYASYAGIRPSAVLKRGWADLPEVNGWFHEYVPGERPIHGPIFVIASSDDKKTGSDGVKQSVARVCRSNKAVTFRTYSGLTHIGCMSQTFADQLAWIQDRFAGKPAPSDCGAR